MGDWSAIYIRMDLGASPATAALGFAAFSLTMALGRFTGDRLVARFSPAAILVAGAVIGALTLGAALLAGHPAAAVIGFAGMGMGSPTSRRSCSAPPAACPSSRPASASPRSRPRATAASSQARR